MAPPVPQFEFSCFVSSAALEAPLGQSPAALEALAAACDTGEAYTLQTWRIRRKWRQIAIPSASLDAVQRDINQLLFPVDLAIPAAANGYITRRSTRSNAEPHAGAKYLQKFDVLDFFGSLRSGDIERALSELGFGREVSELISRLVTHTGRLPLGARTSPRVSNTVLWSFDEEMSTLASQRGVTYTRYADDLAFSSDSPFDLSEEVTALLAPLGLRLNEAKSRSFKYGQPMFVTGLSVSSPNGPTVRKRLKKRLRQELYYIDKHGVDGHAAALREDAGHLPSRIGGELHYLRSIEPETAAKLASLFPSAHRTVLPMPAENRAERAARIRQNFVEQVSAAPPSGLPMYRPTATYATLARSDSRAED